MLLIHFAATPSIRAQPVHFAKASSPRGGER